MGNAIFPYENGVVFKAGNQPPNMFSQGNSKTRLFTFSVFHWENLINAVVRCIMKYPTFNTVKKKHLITNTIKS